MSEATPNNSVRSRLVLMMPGFERVPLQAMCRRFVREAERTAPHYAMSVACTEPEFHPGSCATARFGMHARGDGWAVDSEIVLYELAALNAIYDRRAWPWRFGTGLLSLVDLFVTGTAFRYMRDGWRFFLFYLFPFAFVIGALWLPVVALVPPAEWGARHALWSVPLALAGLAILLKYGREFHLPLMMDLWTITSDVAWTKRPEVERLLDEVAADAAERIARTEADEIIVVGHSFGVVPGLLALGDPRVLEAAKRRPTGLLAAGSYLLAVADHPAAKKLRAAARRVLGSPIAWLDAQAHTDPVNFFRTNPADALGMKAIRRPSIVEVRFKNQLTPESYAKVRGDFFRTHRQFVFGVERRSSYSLFAIIGGPERFADVAAQGGLSPDWNRFA